MCGQLYSQATATHCNSARAAGLVPIQAVVRTEKEIQKEKLLMPLFSVFPPFACILAGSESPGSCHPGHSAGRLRWGEEPRVISLLLGYLVLAEPMGQCLPIVVLPPGSLASAVRAGPCSGIFLFLCKIQGKKITNIP